MAVDATELHRQILDAVDTAHPTGYVWRSADGDGALALAPDDVDFFFAVDRDPYAALRAVVELHAPIRAGEAVWAATDCRTCFDAFGDEVAYPCASIRAVAGALGVEMPNE